MPEPTPGAKGAAEGAPAQGDPENKGTPEPISGVDDDELSNAAWKGHPLTQKLTQQIADLQRKEADRQAAKEAEERQKEIEEAKAKDDFEKASKLQADEADRKVRAAELRAQTAEIKSALLSRGANATNGLVKVALAEWDPEKHATVEALIDDLAENSDYAPFFAAEEPPKRQPLEPPGKTPTNGGSMQWSKAQIEQVRGMELSNDRAERKKARKLLHDYYEAHGSYPYKI